MSVPVVGEFAGSVAALAAVDPRTLAPGELVAGLEQLLTLQTRLEAVTARWLGEATQSEAIVEETGRSPRSWLIEELHRGLGESGRRCKQARWLPYHPVTAAAYAAGDITSDHVSVISTGLVSVPAEFADAAEEALVELCREHAPHEVAAVTDDLLEALGVDKSSDVARARREARRNVSLVDTFRGAGVLSGRLTPLLRQKLDAAFRSLAAKRCPEDDRTQGQRNHDALEEIVDSWLGHGDAPAVNGERPRLVVTVPYDVLLRRLLDLALFDDGTAADATTVRRLACDADIIPAVLGSNGEVLDLGRTTPRWTVAQRRAAWLRDGGKCAFPGCQRSPGELHHIAWVGRDLGPTDLANAAWVCAFHHWLVHENGWSLRRNTDGSYTWTSADGREITGSPPRHPQAA